MREPPRISGISRLQPYLVQRVRNILAGMRCRGFDPVVFETLRTQARQDYLYGIGRTHRRNQRPVTWTRNSMHIRGKAVDIISKSKGWDAPSAFWDTLKSEALKEGMHTIPNESCHIQWEG